MSKSPLSACSHQITARAVYEAPTQRQMPLKISPMGSAQGQAGPAAGQGKDI